MMKIKGFRYSLSSLAERLIDADTVDSPTTQVVLVALVCFATVGMFLARKLSVVAEKDWMSDQDSAQSRSWWYSEYVVRHVATKLVLTAVDIVLSDISETTHRPALNKD